MCPYYLLADQGLANKLPRMETLKGRDVYLPSLLCHLILQQQ